MDNACFNVRGKGKDDLLQTLELAFKILGHKAKSWSFDKQKGLILYWISDAKNTNPFAFGYDAKSIYHSVVAFLESDEATTVEFFEKDDDEDFDHDGHNSLGWRIYTERWGKICKDEYSSYDYSFLAIKPSYCWYGK